MNPGGIACHSRTISLAAILENGSVRAPVSWELPRSLGAIAQPQRVAEAMATRSKELDSLLRQVADHIQPGMRPIHGDEGRSFPWRSDGQPRQPGAPGALERAMHLDATRGLALAIVGGRSRKVLEMRYGVNEPSAAPWPKSAD